MSSVKILDSKFNLKALLEAYLSDVKQIPTTGLTPAELKSRQNYLDAIITIQRVGITDMVKFALSFGRERTGDAKLLESALPTLVCWHVRQPNTIDKQYAAILYRYAISFKVNRHNLKDILLGFALNSSVSPIKPYFDRELDNVILRSKSFH
jgi:hypothetical protein